MLPRDVAAMARATQPLVYPEPSPDQAFDMKTTMPPKFQAFRYSYSRHTVDVRKLDKDSWVLLDNDWPRYFQIKVRRLADRGDKIIQTMPVARDAAWELCQDLAEFLSRRYPSVYRVARSEDNTQGWYRLGSINKIEMPAMGAAYDLNKHDSLTVAGLIQPADINILVKGTDGYYQLAAMMLGIGGGQRIKDKIGKTLADLQFSGHVPHYKEQLQRPLDHFLSELKFESPIQRNTTSISMHDEYHWPALTMGAEDDWDPELRGPGISTSSYGKWKPPGPVKNISQLWFRQERQTLRLPRSGAVVWMVHTYIEPLVEVVREPGVPGRLASFVRSWDDELALHKGRHLYADVLLPYLDDLHKKQVTSGMCDEGQLPSKFPF
ncbi:hypothetical protein GCG54_00010521 [Colletotrichum gloeosporioides]|uniref:Uncharacterized protein n=1 Tax=Colletotrichum gloeosporioides TaxID=474922 RepID=A0A8H4C6G9_COLGL|nr:uncharacterized protein GCG54_00010521 [Colletotrichum gloeosporioides]KAF3798175.1 hypothetical protein GCG54_00010521 [Colletotrichum gloeosporioides]